jgi:hypothetical protein
MNRLKIIIIAIVVGFALSRVMPPKHHASVDAVAPAVQSTIS